MKSLYLLRPVLNSREICAYYEAQGIACLDPASLHVNIMTSTRPVDWSLIGLNPDSMILSNQGDRKYLSTHNGTIFCLGFGGEALIQRWLEGIRLGCSWEHRGYHPHIAISKDPLIQQVVPFGGPIVLGAERRSEIGAGEQIKYTAGEDFLAGGYGFSGLAPDGFKRSIAKAIW